MKNNKVEIITIVMIVLTVIIIGFNVIMVFIRNNKVKDFDEYVLEIYDIVLEKKELNRNNDSLSLDEKSNYYGQVLIDNQNIEYIAVFDPTTEKLSYFCVSNKIKKLEVSGNIDKDYITTFGVEENTNKKCEYKKVEANEE